MTNQQTAIARTNGQRQHDVSVAEPWIAANVDIFENEQEILLDADFPGVDDDAVSVHLDGPILTLEGLRPAIGGWVGASRLRRTFTVPDTVDPDRVEAELSGGVLRVRMPKREDAKPRRIAVRSKD